MNACRSLVTAAAVACLASCTGSNGTGITALRLRVQVAQSVDATAIASLRFTITGDESWMGTVPAPMPVSGEYRFRYLPGVKSGSLDFLVEALAGDGAAVVASGRSATPAAVVAGAEGEVVIVLSPGPQPEPPPEEIEPEVDGGEAEPDAEEPADSLETDVPEEAPPDAPVSGQLGDPCTGDGDCESAHCVRQNASDAQGTCCDTPCAAGCMSCALDGTVGTCSPIPAGMDPREGCAVSAMDPCGDDGTCDGAGACRKRKNGTICVGATCSGVSYTPPSTCVDGFCQPGGTTDCTPYRCDLAGCLKSCASSDQCAPGKTCNASSCGLKAPGAGCGSDGECATGLCRQGVCCRTDCGGCYSCATPTNPGTCTPLPAGTPPAGTPCPVDPCHNGSCNGTGACTIATGAPCMPPSCPAGATDATVYRCSATGSCVGIPVSCMGYVCNPGTNTCKMTCAGDTDCAPGFTCKSGQCAARQPQGSPCSGDSQCASGFCRDGFCCNGACVGTCVACSSAKTGQPNGFCRPITAGTDPDGECGAYVCSGSAACFPSCAPSASGCSPSCNPSYWCSGSTCTPRSGPGASCTADCACTSGTCATYYPDNDGDGYGDTGPTMSFCTGGFLPSGWVDNSSDCCDMDNVAFPGAPDYHTQPDRCGIWDYDCSGTDDPQYTQMFTYSCSSDCTKCMVTQSGWIMPSPPMCGEKASFATSTTTCLPITNGTSCSCQPVQATEIGQQQGCR